jgi:diguanylate cyclase (GGDEF)-like protein
LFNRRFLDATLERMTLQRARLEPEDRPAIAAILFDLDRFGDFNKRHGHRVGDSVLRGFASVLRRRLRGSDLVVRYGGEEFLVVLPGADRESAARIADEIRLEFRAQAVTGIDGAVLGATVSAGCSEMRPEDTSVSGLIEAADVGLIMAKIGGRDQVVAACRDGPRTGSRPEDTF